MTLKDYILKEIGQVAVFSEYLNISEEDITYSAKFKSKIKSPFHRDSDPSLSFKYYGSRLICRDFSNVLYTGDIFQIVGICINKDCRDKAQFIDICKDIINTNELFKSGKQRPKQEDKTESILEPTTIDFISRLFNGKDFKYFWRFNLNRKTVSDGYIPVNTYSINGFPSKYYSSSSDPCYAYVNNPGAVKLYFPLRQKNQKRFISNNRFPVELIHTIVKKDYTILIKAYKDKLLMDYVCNLLGIYNIQFLPVASESARIPVDVIALIRKYTNKRIFTMFDLDRCGIDSAIYYRDIHGFGNLFLGDGLRTKDPTDLIEVIKLESFLKRFLSIYNTF